MGPAGVCSMESIDVPERERRERKCSGVAASSTNSFSQLTRTFILVWASPRILLDRYAGDVRADDGKRHAKVFELHFAEAGSFNRAPCFAIGLAAVRQHSPKSGEAVLPAACACFACCRHVLDKNKPAARLQHAADFAERRIHIAYRTKYQRGDYDIHAAVCEIEM